MAEPLLVHLDADVAHLAVRDRDEDGRYGAPTLEDDHGRPSIERALVELDPRAGSLAADDLQQGSHLPAADDGTADVADAAVAHHTGAGIGDEHGVVREHLEQRVL